MIFLSKKNPQDKLTSKQIGYHAEKQARVFLRKQGLKIIESNYFCRRGEIDIIAQDGSYLVFVEVKYRQFNQFGNPLEMVSLTKQKKIISTAQHYLLKIHPMPNCRFDVIAIEKNKTEQWIKNAFSID